jgi:hypothetical protein
MLNAGLGLLGVALVQRGATGHCALYQTLGFDTARPQDHGPRRLEEKTYGYGKRGETSIRDEIEKASKDSFPASDPPAWTPIVRLGPPCGVDEALPGAILACVVNSGGGLAPPE